MRRYFTNKEKEELLSNPNIVRVINSNVVYTKLFKELACKQHFEQGVFCNEVFRIAGIPDWLNIGDYARNNIRRWKSQLHRKIKPKIGRPNKTLKKVEDMTPSEALARIAYLEAENEFLKKLSALG